MSVSESHSLAGEPIESGRFDLALPAAKAFDVSVTKIIRHHENDMRPPGSKRFRYRQEQYDA